MTPTSFRISAAFLIASTFCASALADSERNTSEVLSGGYIQPTDKRVPPRLTNNQVKTQRSAPITDGWNWFTCDWVTRYVEGKNTVVAIGNNDGTRFTASAKSSSATATQILMTRACFRAGAAYAVYITNSATLQWSDMSAY
jgi:hypothetical protein